MTAKKHFLIILSAGVIVLMAVAVSSRYIGNARVLQPAQTGVTIPYTGYLTDEASNPVADGVYDFIFTLYKTESGGEPLWTEKQVGVAVRGGGFTALLGSVAPLPQEALDGGARWLEVNVRGPGETEFTPLSPRQELSAAAPAELAASANGLSCAHTHWGEAWSGSGNGLILYGNSNGFATLFVRDKSPTGGYAVYGRSNGTSGTGVYGWASATSGNTEGVFGQNDSTSGIGVYGEATAPSGTNAGVWGRSWSAEGYGVNGENLGNGIAIFGWNKGSGRNQATIRAINTNTEHGMTAYFDNNSDYHTAHFYNAGSGGVLYLQNGGTGSNGTGGWDFISAQNKDETDLQFRVLTSGEVRSDVGFNTPAADFAEMLPAVEGLEPGDVLIIGVDGKLTRSTEANQSTVVGVYSTQPGFVGGQPVEGELEGHIPLAVVGVVPVKVSAENGPIQLGDLLVASSTPAHAMKAGPNPAVGTVIGKALGSLESGTGVIQMLIMLR